jgi:hypothetical protein
METTSIEMTSMETTSMETRQLHSSQKEALKKILEFSGESNELDIDEWLFDLTNLFSLMKLKDETKILETMGKLTGPALRWYQENLRSFIDWDDTETALRNRFKEFTSDSQLMQEFFQIQQEENQSVTSFYENVIRKYRKARKFITEQQVITVLQTGVKNSLKEHLIRNEKEIRKPDEWLQIAREEEYIQKRIQQQRNNFYLETTEQSFFEPAIPVAAIRPKPSSTQVPNPNIAKSFNHNQGQRQRHYHVGNNRNHRKENHQQSVKPSGKNHFNNHAQQTDSCLICNRENHPTIKCFYKKENGCFKCGQSNHRIRDCPKRHFFE